MSAHARVARADGGDPDPGSLHRRRLALRAEVRRHPPARLQARQRREALFAQPAAAEHPADRKRDRRDAGEGIDPRRRSHLGSPQRLSRLRHPLARRREHDVPAARGTPRAAREADIHGAAAARRPARRHGAVGAGAARGLGRRDRQAPRLAVRASPLEALAEDEDRSLAGARRRRLHRSARRARRPRRAAGRLLRQATTSSSRERSAPASTPSCCSICGDVSMRSRFRRHRSPSRKACRACARTGCVRRSSCRSPSSSGRATTSSGIRA